MAPLIPPPKIEAQLRGRPAARCGLSSDERDFLRSSHGLPVEGIGRHRDLRGLDGARPLPGMAAKAMLEHRRDVFPGIGILPTR